MAYPTDYDEYITSAAEKYGVDPNLIRGIIQQESSWRPKVGSKAGALGLMQLRNIAVEDMGYDPATFDRTDPALNIEVGTGYFAKLLKRFDGDVEAALQAYNAGPTLVSKLARRDKLDRLPDETKEYPGKVLGHKAKFEEYQMEQGLIQTDEDFDILAEALDAGEVPEEQMADVIAALEQYEPGRPQGGNSVGQAAQRAVEQQAQRYTGVQRAAIGAGRELGSLVTGIRQRYAQATGDEETLAKLQAKEQSERELYAALDDKQIGAEDAGQLFPYLVTGGTGRAAVALGAAQGAATATTEDESAVINILTSALGAKAGNMLGDVAARVFTRPASGMQSKVAARIVRDARKLGITLGVDDVASDAGIGRVIGGVRDWLRAHGTYAYGRDTQRREAYEAATRIIGTMTPKAKSVLFNQATRDTLYAQVRGTVSNNKLTTGSGSTGLDISAWIDDLARLGRGAAEVGLGKTKANQLVGLSRVLEHARAGRSYNESEVTGTTVKHVGTFASMLNRAGSIPLAAGDAILGVVSNNKVLQNTLIALGNARDKKEIAKLASVATKQFDQALADAAKSETGASAWGAEEDSFRNEILKDTLPQQYWDMWGRFEEAR